MHKFVRNLITEWRRLGLPFNDATVIVAVSGGADSTALSLAFADLKKRKKLELEFVIAHFNHKLRRKESDGDETFVKNLAAKLEFEFVSANGSLKGKSDLEQRTRDARYKFLGETANTFNANVILTAHTMNDQAETVLMNLIRGSGIDGLGGIKKMRELNEKQRVKLVRPLLKWAKRGDTESFCHDNKIKPRHDSMNDDMNFTRVKIRKTVIPLLADVNPNIIETLARTGELLQSVSHENKENFGDSLKIADLKNLQQNELYSHIRAWLREKRGNLRGLQLKHIEAVVRLANSRKSGRIVELPGGQKVIKTGGRLAFRQIRLEN
ncbi:MAG: tRNA lysidine(34) synthetase TilS [Pyrinomonadaceae bacterium]